MTRKRLHVTLPIACHRALPVTIQNLLSARNATMDIIKIVMGLVHNVILNANSVMGRQGLAV
jgi:hypothetical protein